MPVLDLPQDSLDVGFHRYPPPIGLGDRNRAWRDRIGEIGFGRDLWDQLEIEGDRLG